MQYFYDYGHCAASHQSDVEDEKTFNKYNGVIIELGMAYWNIWDLFTDYFPFSLERPCASPNPELFKEPPRCRYDMLFNDQCDWECYHKNCDYDFYGGDDDWRGLCRRAAL